MAGIVTRRNAGVLARLGRKISLAIPHVPARLCSPQTDVFRPTLRFGHSLFGHSTLIRHSPLVIRHSRALAVAALALAVSGCYQRKQAAVLNPDGSGKMTIETIVSVPAQAAGNNKLTPADFGKQLAASLINNTNGVDAWADMDVSEVKDSGGKVRIVGTAYFPDINKLKFDMPIEFVWKRELEGATLTVQRTRSASRAAITSDAQLKDTISKAQKQYKETQQLVWQTQLNVFELDMSFDLPGELTDSNLFAKNGNKVSFKLDGKKAAQAIDKFMADDAALTAMFKAGQDSQDNDDYLLKVMNNEKGPVFARLKLGLEAKPAFDYKLESRTASVKQSDMLQAAGIELIPKFIVTDATTAPATRPAARGR